MKTNDPPEVTRAIDAFQFAWEMSTKRYAATMINSERCLQACLYHYMQSKLGEDFTVYIEAVVKNPAGQKITVDTMIVHKKEVVLAAELKYTPRGTPPTNKIQKDVLSLSSLTNLKSEGDLVSIEIGRFRNRKKETLFLSMAKKRKLIFAAYFKEESKHLNGNNFWNAYRPTLGYWSKSKRMPPNFGLSLAKADKDGRAEASYVGTWLNS